jgi:hypothetical protein
MEPLNAVAMAMQAARISKPNSSAPPCLHVFIEEIVQMGHCSPRRELFGYFADTVGAALNAVNPVVVNKLKLVAPVTNDVSSVCPAVTPIPARI